MKKAMPAKKSWFNTLNESLEKEGLLDLWPLGLNIEYGETARVFASTDGGLKLISIYRNDIGLYERPVHTWVVYPSHDE